MQVVIATVIIVIIVIIIIIIIITIIMIIIAEMLCQNFLKSISATTIIANISSTIFERYQEKALDRIDRLVSQSHRHPEQVMAIKRGLVYIGPMSNPH
jgi:hypothetical protein